LRPRRQIWTEHFRKSNKKNAMRYTHWRIPYRPKIPQLAAETQIPAIYQYGYFVEHGGGLMSYGPDIVALIAHAADSLDKILKGTSPGDLPIEQPTKFEFVLNL
jgi:putative ABC transport system substrate-binding protein